MDSRQYNKKESKKRYYHKHAKEISLKRRQQYERKILESNGKLPDKYSSKYHRTKIIGCKGETYELKVRAVKILTKHE